MSDGKGTFNPILPNPGGPVGAPVLNPGRNPLEGLLGTAGSALRQFESDMDERAKKKAAEAKAAREDREEQARKYLAEDFAKTIRETTSRDPWLDLTKGTSGVPFSNPAASQGNDIVPAGTVNPSDAIISGAVDAGQLTPGRAAEIEDGLREGAEEIQNISTSVEQGNMPRQATMAAADRMFTEALAMYPDVDPEVILSFMDKMGVKSYVGYDLKRQYMSREAIDDARDKQYSEAYEKGLEILGPLAASMPDASIAATGMTEIQSQLQIDNTLKQLELKTSQATLTEKENAMAEKEAATSLQQQITQSYYNQMAPFIETVHNILGMMPEAGSDPALEEKYEEAIALLKQKQALAMESLLGKVMASGLPDSATRVEAIRKQFEQLWENTILNPIEARDTQQARLATKLKDEMGLTLAQTYPFITAMKAMGVQVSLADVILENLDDPMRVKLTEELASLSTLNIYDISQRSSAQLHVANAVRILKGEASINNLDMTPEQASQVLKTVNGTLRGINTQIAQGNYTNAEEWLNGMGTLAVASAQLGNNSSTNSVISSITALSGGGKRFSALTFDDMMKGKVAGIDPEEAQVIGLGTRSAMANGLSLLLQKPKRYGLHDVVYNEGTNRWEVKLNEQRAREAKKQFDLNPRVGGGEGGYILPNTSSWSLPKPSREAVALKDSLNTASIFLVKSKELDEGPLSKASNEELFRFYNMGEVPKSVAEGLQKEQAEQKAKSSPKTAADVYKALEQLKNDLEDSPFNFEVPTIMGPQGVPVDAQGNPTTTITNEAAGAMDFFVGKGIPRQVAAGIVGNLQQESGIDFGQRGTYGDSGTAIGVAQWRKERRAKFQEVMGKRIEDSSLQEQLEFVYWELMNPYEHGVTEAQRDAILGASSPSEAAVLFDKYYERSNGKHRQSRSRYAETLYKN